MHPPGKVLSFLRWFCREDYIDEIEGDLTELFKPGEEYEERVIKSPQSTVDPPSPPKADSAGKQSTA
jgi:hypothetical protein